MAIRAPPAERNPGAVRPDRHADVCTSLTEEPTMRKRLTFLVLLLSGVAWLRIDVTTSPESTTSLEDEVLRNATLVFEQATRMPNVAVPAGVLLRARGIVVVPAARTAGTLYYGV